MKKAILMITIIGIVFVSACSGPKGATVEDKRDYVGKVEKEVLELMRQEYPETDKVGKAPGYAVFTNWNVNVIFASVGNGYGVVVNNKTGQRTYMNMALGGVGLGIGVKDFRQLIVFLDEKTMESFVDNGWEFGGHADAAVKADDKGAAVNTAGDVTSGMEIYQVTKAGIALQATVTAAKYWKDKHLN